MPTQNNTSLRERFKWWWFRTFQQKRLLKADRIMSAMEAKLGLKGQAVVDKVKEIVEEHRRLTEENKRLTEKIREMYGQESAGTIQETTTRAAKD